MQEILEKYKERLINISSRNRSLSMKKLYKKNSFDLFRLKKYYSSIDTDIIDFLINRKGSTLKLIQDPYKWQEDKIKLCKKEIDEEINTKLNEPMENVEASKKYEDKLNSKLTEIKNQTEELIDFSQCLNYLLREINSTEKETGRYELFVGYPFVEGYFKDKTFVKAPILLFPVRIIKQGDNWLLENIQEQSILLNKVFLLAFSKYNETKLNDIETEFTDLTEASIDTIDGLLKYLSNNEIVIKKQNNDSVIRFVETSKDTEMNYLSGEINLKEYLILGQFPVANSIYNDYLELEKTEVNNELLSKLLINEDKIDLNTQNNGEEEKQNVKEGDFYFISSLDYSQEKAIRKANITNKLVMYGPPGTGKSQTIANIISDGLAKGKKILMVSQKRAALDVIYNRISNFESKVILIHDANKDKRAFYDKIASELDETFVNDNSTVINDISEKSFSVDKEISCLDNVGKILHKKREFGLTLQQMYTMSKRITSKEDERFEDFKIFRDKNLFENVTYEALKKTIEELKNKGITDKYIDYRKCINENKIIVEIKDGIDNFDIEDYIDKINELQSKNETKIQVNEEKYSKKLLQLYIDKKYSISDNDIFNLSCNINKEENKDLLVKLNDGRWWSIIYWINYSKNKSQEESNKLEFEKRGAEIKESLQKYDLCIKEFLNNISFAQKILLDKEYYSFLNTAFEGKDIKEYLSSITSALKVYENYRNLVSSLFGLNDIQTNVLKYTYDNSKDDNHFYYLLSELLEYAILLNISNIEKVERDELSKYKDFSAIRTEVNNLMQEKQKLIPKYIINKWDSRLFSAIDSNIKEEKELKRQAMKKRALWPIRKYVAEFSEILFDIFPCWLLSPETVSEILPLANGMFDLIIFDEASQMFIENAIPSIYRSKSIVIAGDDKQLKPTSMFKVRLDDSESEENDNIETAAAYEEESLLDLAKVNYDSVNLNYHYRSRYDELINFSNYAFYNGRLEVSPNLNKFNNNIEKPIERIMVSGKWVDRKNEVEAEKVVEIVEKILKGRKENETVGIITFNINQKDLIDDMLENRASKDSEFKDLYESETNRVEDNEDMSIFVKNIENVQGDERDIIIFSTAYAKNESNKLMVNFGSLSQDGGENRLNVAISRAKKKIYLVTSIEPEELNVETTKNNGPKLFKKYLQYVREVSDGNKDGAKNILIGLLDSDVSRKDSEIFESPFETEVYEALKSIGYDIDTQVGVSGYRIDMAVYNKEDSKYVLGIECDGATYHSAKSARERDIHRQRYLESRGWKIIRIWSKDWWEDKDKELNRIDSYIKCILKE